MGMPFRSLLAALLLAASGQAALIGYIDRAALDGSVRPVLVLR